MGKHTKVNKKSNLKIHRLITVKEFLKRINRDPDSIYEDFDVKYAIEKLGQWYLSNNDLQKENGERILKKAGLGAYIPKSPRGNLKKYKKNPQRLFQEVDTLANELKKEFPKRERQRQELAKRIKEKYKIKLKGKFLDDCRLMAIGIMADQNYVTGWTLYKVYYQLKEQRGNKNIFFDWNEYHQAYSNYVLKEHLTYELNEKMKPIRKALVSLQNEIEERFKPLQPIIAKVQKQLEEISKPLRQALSNIPELKISNLSRTG